MVLVPPAWWAGGWGPTQGVALVLKLTLISCGVVGALMVLGEFSREELQGARRALAARLSRRGTG